jgi:hypothetical protein
MSGSSIWAKNDVFNFLWTFVIVGKYDRKPYKEKLTDNLLSFCSNRGGTYPLFARENTDLKNKTPRGFTTT